MSGEGRYPHQVTVDGYGNGGFRFAGMSHRGSLLCLPVGMVAWAPAYGADFGDSLLAALASAQPLPSLVIVGTGASLVMPDLALRAGLASLGAALEAMDTGAAVRTYNVMFGEGRDVGAALVAVG
ncbi:MAG: Mth938-like domain-containing protein [Hyphomicrobium sp.]|nr:Mth938-like domain-containing protein [Hyphomicrobium sp.]